MHSLPSSQSPIRAEYTIYAYHSDENNACSRTWTKLMTSSDKSIAKEQAESLFNSQKFSKVEIQKKYFDEKRGQKRAESICIYENKNKQNYFIVLSLFFLTFSLLGFLAL